jgi:hypothetical protein
LELKAPIILFCRYILLNPSRSASVPIYEWINTALLEETAMVSSEAFALQGTDDYSLDLPPSPLFASMSVTRPKSQQALKSEIQSPKRRCLTFHSNCLIFYIFANRNLRNMYGN